MQISGEPGLRDLHVNRGFHPWVLWAGSSCVVRATFPARQSLRGWVVCPKTKLVALTRQQELGSENTVAEVTQRTKCLLYR